MSVKERSGGVSKTDFFFISFFFFFQPGHLSAEVSDGGTKPGSGQGDSSGAGVTLGRLVHFGAVNNRAEINRYLSERSTGYCLVRVTFTESCFSLFLSALSK